MPSHDPVVKSAAVRRYQKTPKGKAAKRRAAIKRGWRDDNLRRYGLTISTWNIMFFEQGMKCKCCGTYDPGTKLWWHTHHTGSKKYGTLRVHGILCHHCNHALTKHTTPAGLRLLANFLETYYED